MEDGSTYADCGEDILKLVDKGNQPRVVDIDPVERCGLEMSMRYVKGVCCALTHSHSWQPSLAVNSDFFV